jgi:hypothetical protein
MKLVSIVACYEQSSCLFRCHLCDFWHSPGPAQQDSHLW